MVFHCCEICSCMINLKHFQAAVHCAVGGSGYHMLQHAGNQVRRALRKMVILWLLSVSTSHSIMARNMAQTAPIPASWLKASERKMSWDQKPNSTLRPDTSASLQQVLGRIHAGMLFIEGGELTRGCDQRQSSLCYADEFPVSRIRQQGFWLSKYEITQADWLAVMGANPSLRLDCPGCPVENVSWLDVQAFLEKLRSLSGLAYRLPTEAEWEFAAKGGRYGRQMAADSLELYAWFGKNSGGMTHPVGTRLPDALGLYDMIGNVFEWCADDFLPYDMDKSPARNGTCPNVGSEKVIRGGGWWHFAALCRPASRNAAPATYCNGHIGFRLALTTQ